MISTLIKLNIGDKEMTQKKEKKKEVKPGEKTPDSGIYENESGEKTTQVEGHTAPPTPKKGEKHKQKVDTNPNN